MNSKQVKWAVLGVVLVLVAITGVLLATNRGSDSASGDVVYQTTTVAPTSNVFGKGDEPYTRSGEVVTPAEPSSVEATTSAASTSSAPAPTSGPPAGTSTPAAPAVDGRAPTNFPMKKLAPGEKPPQFIIFSFDGVGSLAKLQGFMDTAAANNARFTGFLTGLYVIADDKSDVYTAPGGRQGASEVGFAGPESEAIDRVALLNKFYLAGNEVGTHYNGHFCDLGANWSTAEWNSELDQNFDFLKNWKTINGTPDAADFVFPLSEVKGGRTPCLAGQFDQLVPAWQAHGMTYDSSVNSPVSGLIWPQKVQGIWEFYMPNVWSPPLQGHVIAMDYNFSVKYQDGKADTGPDLSAQLTPAVLETYRYMYDEAFNGNRAPLVIGNHFENWNGNAFNPAVDQFMSEACTKADTYCATYQDVIAWMELQDPAVLQTWLDKSAVAGGPN